MPHVQEHHLGHHFPYRQIDVPGGASSTSSLTFDIWIDDLYLVNK